MINKKTFKKVGLIMGIIAIPSVIIGGYFAMSHLNPYNKFYRIPINSSTDGFISAYSSAVSLGAKVIVCAGFTHKSPILETFTKKFNEFKDTGFVLLDEKMISGEPGAANTWGVTYRSDLGSFRTGIALGQFLNENQDTFLGDDKQLTFGSFGGQDFSSVTSFMGGLQKGVAWFNDNVAKEGITVPNTEYKYQKVIELIPESIKKSGNNFSGGFGPGQGDNIIKQYIDANVDALMPVAGPQIWDAQRIIEQQRKPIMLIGVDSPIEINDLNKTSPFFNKNNKKVGNGRYVQFSSEKNLSLSIIKGMEIINNGNQLPDGIDKSEYFGLIDETGLGGFGTSGVGNIENGCVNVSQMGMPYFQEATKGSDDPSKLPIRSDPEEMFYSLPLDKGKPKLFYYGNKSPDSSGNFVDNPYGLDLEFSINVESPGDALDMKDFIRKNTQSDDNKIKIILSEPTAILFDGSFSESTYLGLYEWYKLQGIHLPYKGSK